MTTLRSRKPAAADAAGGADTGGDGTRSSSTGDRGKTDVGTYLATRVGVVVVLVLLGWYAGLVTATLRLLSYGLMAIGVLGIIASEGIKLRGGSALLLLLGYGCLQLVPATEYSA